MGLEQRDRLALIHDYSRALIESSVDLIFILDADAIFKYISPSVERILGYTREEMVGRSVFEYVQFDEIKEAHSVFERVKSESVAGERFNFHVEHADGHWVCMEVVGESYLGDPEIRGVVIDARDITRREMVECELCKAEERFKAIIDSIPETIAVIDVEGNARFVGEPISMMLGYNPEEIEGINFYDLVHPDDLEGVLSDSFKVGQGPGARASFLCRVRGKDGKWRHIEAISINYTDNPYIAGIIAVARDVTERVTEEERMEEALKTLIESASQEFRQHIAILKGYASTLRSHRGELDEEALDRILKTMEASTDHLNDLLKGLSYAEEKRH